MEIDEDNERNEAVPNTSRISFEDLGICQQLCSSCRNLNMTEPTEIQRLAIPVALRGDDVIAEAKTGSGKTLAFALPILQALLNSSSNAQDSRSLNMFALVLSPSRELATQTRDCFRALSAASAAKPHGTVAGNITKKAHKSASSSPLNLMTALLIGGMPEEPQNEELRKRPHVIVGTPGRLLKLISTSAELSETQLRNNVRFLVIDEADSMLDTQFETAMNKIIRLFVCGDDDHMNDATTSTTTAAVALKSRRQTLLFSATNKKNVEKLRNRLGLLRPTLVKVNDKPKLPQQQQTQQSKQPIESKQKEDEQQENLQQQPDGRAERGGGVARTHENVREFVLPVKAGEENTYLVWLLRRTLRLADRGRLDSFATNSEANQIQVGEENREKAAEDREDALVDFPNLCKQGGGREGGASRRFMRSCIIFVDTKKESNILYLFLKRIGFKVLEINGGMTQQKRKSAILKMKLRHNDNDNDDDDDQEELNENSTNKQENFEILVATDLIGRGLDFPAVDMIVNVRVPEEHKTYAHRIGRTGRAGRTGIAITMATRFQIGRLHLLQAELGWHAMLPSVYAYANTSTNACEEDIAAQRERQQEEEARRRNAVQREVRRLTEIVQNVREGAERDVDVMMQAAAGDSSSRALKHARKKFNVEDFAGNSAATFAKRINKQKVKAHAKQQRREGGGAQTHTQRKQERYSKSMQKQKHKKKHHRINSIHDDDRFFSFH